MAAGSVIDNDDAVGSLLVLEMVKHGVGERVCFLSFSTSFILSFLFFSLWSGFWKAKGFRLMRLGEGFGCLGWMGLGCSGFKRFGWS